jgi:hypothetical protein
MVARRRIACLAFAGLALAAAPASAQGGPPDLVQAVVRSLPFPDQKAAESMGCRQISTRTPAQQYCTWRVYGRNSFAEIWGAVATQVAPNRWIVVGPARAAATKDVPVRARGPDEGKLVTLEACLRANGVVEQAGRTGVCNQR